MVQYSQVTRYLCIDAGLQERAKYGETEQKNTAFNMDNIQDIQTSSEQNESIFFLAGIFNETLALLLETHEYFNRYGRINQRKISEHNRMLYSREMSRITIRLSSVMAWLMAQKAVASGQISQQVATENYRLDCKETCLEQTEEAKYILPDSMNQLLSESYRIYSRVNRLDEQMADAQATLH